MRPAITAQDLTRRFTRRGKDGTVLTAVDHLTLEVEQGQVFGFLGPNGAGKTTTVRLLNGLLAPSAGEAHVLGHDVATQAVEIRRLSGVLPEVPSLYESMTARQNLAFFGELYDVPAGALSGRIDVLLARFGLAERADDQVGTYSKGMRQRLAIARALFHEPRIVFLDEPTAGLDPAAARLVRQTIQRLSHQNRTIFMCTHNLVEAQELCDRVAVIDQGVLQAIGTPQELARSLWHSQWVDIDLRAKPSATLLEKLSYLESVLACNGEPDKLALEIDDEKHIPDVVAAIAAAGGRIYSVRPREHTLEDIYFKIQENRSSDAATTSEGGGTL